MKITPILSCGWRIENRLLFIAFRFCAETKAELISTGWTPSKSEILFCHSFFIFTFSSNQNLGLSSFKISRNTKNNRLLGSSKFKPLPAQENPWHGLPAINRSILGSCQFLQKLGNIWFRKISYLTPSLQIWMKKRRKGKEMRWNIRKSLIW